MGDPRRFASRTALLERKRRQGSVDRASPSPSAGPRTRWPAVSVIIPARNAEDAIGSTLDSIFAQDYAGPMEVFVADGSDTCTMADMVRQRYPAVRLVANPDRIAASGLNAMLNLATGEIVVRCDAHATLPPAYVRTAVEAIEKTGAANVGGVMAPVGATFFGRAVALAMTSLLGSGGSRHRYGGVAGPIDTVYLGVFKRRTLDEVGGYNVTMPLNEDYELNWRLRQQCGTVWFDPSLRVQYRTRKTWRAFARQYLGYGWSKQLMFRKHPASVRPRHLAASAPAAALAASVVMGIAGAPWALAGALPALYASTLFAYSLMAGIRQREAAAVLVPLVLTTMHLCWSIGLLMPTRFFLPARIQRRLARWSERTDPGKPPSEAKRRSPFENGQCVER